MSNGTKSDYPFITCDGGPAFPFTPDTLQTGMSLRDYFAGMAMDRPVTGSTPEDIAAEAYAIADAMLRERAKKL